MFILRFTFENHASFRDEVDLTLVKPSLRTASPQEGTWLDHTTRVAALYGSNASGKSTVLDALRYMQACVSNSATSWSRRRALPRAPFALDTESKSRPSTYILDFALNDVRYEYGFSVSHERVEEEWLYSFPTGRKRIAFERGAGESGVTAGRELGGGGPTLNRATGERELVLSRGASLKHALLTEVFDALTEKLDIATFSDSNRQSRLHAVVQDVADGSLALDDLRTMLRVADVGILGAQVDDGPEADPKIVKLFRGFIQLQREVQSEHHEPEQDEGSTDPAQAFDELGDEAVQELFAEVARSLMFMHRGAGEQEYALPSSLQSTGTLTWLSLAAPAIKTIREGGVLAVDELDASLHPQLAQVMIQMFRDESINRTGAQLIFTTHDTYFLSPSSDSRLTPEEVWLVEKNQAGVSDLYRLSEFPTRTDQNLSRRYLQGRYGAIPSVAPSFLASLVQRERDDCDAETV